MEIKVPLLLAKATGQYQAPAEEVQVLVPVALPTNRLVKAALSAERIDEKKLVVVALVIVAFVAFKLVPLKVVALLVEAFVVEELTVASWAVPVAISVLKIPKLEVKVVMFPVVPIKVKALKDVPLILSINRLVYDALVPTMLVMVAFVAFRFVRSALVADNVSASTSVVVIPPELLAVT